MKEFFYPLPKTDITQAEQCVEISFCVPCDDILLANIRGALWSLTKWHAWERDEQKRAKDVAQCLRHWLEDTYQEC